MKHRRSLLVAASLLATGVLALPALTHAQAAYPNKPIKFVVPYSTGGLPDTVARIFAQRLSERLGQSVVVDNKPGANGVVAAQSLASSPADGYTFLVTDGSMFSINPALYKNLSYDYKRDFVAVSLAARAPLYLAVHPKTGVNTLQEFVALAKAKPGKLNYGSSGVGSSHHLTMEAMKAALGIDVQHVPFKGSGQSVPALIGGQVDVDEDQPRLLAVGQAQVDEPAGGRVQRRAGVHPQGGQALPPLPLADVVAGVQVRDAALALDRVQEVDPLRAVGHDVGGRREPLPLRRGQGQVRRAVGQGTYP